MTTIMTAADVAQLPKRRSSSSITHRPSRNGACTLLTNRCKDDSGVLDGEEEEERGGGAWAR